MKRIFAVLLALLLIFSLSAGAFAADAEAETAAQELFDLGLFSGTGTDAAGKPVFDLDRAPTRAEAVTMLVRLLGKSDAAITFSGTGDQVITGVNIPAGSYYAEYIHSGKSNFITRFYYGDKEYDYVRISNEIGRCSGQVSMWEDSNLAVTNGMLSVRADGNWTISFKPVSGKTTTNVSGHGEVVTGIFTATSARNAVSMTHKGESNFIAKVIEYNADERYDYESLANEIGVYSGQKLITLTPGVQYFFYVRADGDWTINFGTGDALTTYAPPEIP